MRRLIISCAVVAVALLAQLTFVNRLALPGGTGPDLVLLAVVALALTGGPIPGMLTGFLAGLALDVAPPASHTIGQYALVFCLVGYGCGRLAGLGERVARAVRGHLGGGGRGGRGPARGPRRAAQ